MVKKVIVNKTEFELIKRMVVFPSLLKFIEKKGKNSRDYFELDFDKPNEKRIKIRKVIVEAEAEGIGWFFHNQLEVPNRLYRVNKRREVYLNLERKGLIDIAQFEYIDSRGVRRNKYLYRLKQTEEVLDIVLRRCIKEGFKEILDSDYYQTVRKIRFEKVLPPIIRKKETAKKKAKLKTS